MEKKPSLDQILTEMAEMIQMIENYKGSINPPESPKGLLASLEMLNQLLETVEEMVLDPIASRVDFDTLTKETLESTEISSSQKQLILHAQDVSNEAKVLESAFSKALNESKKRKKSKKGGKEAARAQEMRDRRKLFKTIGGDKKWIPL